MTITITLHTNPNGQEAATTEATGQVDPAARWLCQVTGDPVAPDACFACARERRQPQCDFTPAVLRALHSSMQPDPALLAVRTLAQQAGVTLLRVSSLTGCTRQAWYHLHQRPPLETPARHWARLRGAIFHKALQHMAGREIVAERRFVVSLQAHGVDAWIAGQVDHYDPDTGVLTDLKTINTHGRRLAGLDLPKAHHRAQLWIYAWLLAHSGWPYPQAGQIVYLDMGAIRTVPVAMPSPEAQALVERRLLQKARAIVEAAAQGPAGDAREAWQCRYCAFKDQCPDRDAIAAG